jgi:hypothetical protein
MVACCSRDADATRVLVAYWQASELVNLSQSDRRVLPSRAYRKPRRPPLLARCRADKAAARRLPPAVADNRTYQRSIPVSSRTLAACPTARKPMGDAIGNFADPNFPPPTIAVWEQSRGSRYVTACQWRTGAVISNQARFRRDQVEIAGNSAKWIRKAESGNATTYHFCPTCGSTLFWEDEGFRER